MTEDEAHLISDPFYCYVAIEDVAPHPISNSSYYASEECVVTEDAVHRLVSKLTSKPSYYYVAAGAKAPHPISNSSYYGNPPPVEYVVIEDVEHHLFSKPAGINTTRDYEKVESVVAVVRRCDSEV